eukprot:CAMPEP_0197433060 /NCGR_PEP_ID=MMETSP1175-20131217/1009_1 /TAXON_ID=1003142 /ORGANISM="Triceratium dubium, Strain CCMP147" /LENGTH=274 /DNA_ID=CAMNT_0042961321 /DNA_START=78 /DNA_END=902 /DNA_ORIENTATION=+
MSPRSLDNNHEVLDETEQLQQATRAAVSRMQRQVAETHSVGTATLETLYTQRKIVTKVDSETGRLNANLDATDRLQNKLSRWTLTFNRRKARRQARNEIQAQSKSSATPRTPAELEHRLAQARERKRTNEAWNALETLAIDRTEDETDTESENMASKSSLGATTNSTVPSTTLAAQDTTTMARYAHGTKRSNKDDHDDGKINDRLAQINEADADLNGALDGLGSQLDGLLNLAKAQHEESTMQANMLDSIQTRVETAQISQKAANHRAKGFLRR